MDQAVGDLKRVLGKVKSRELQAFEKTLLDAGRVFVTGLGRTGLMARGFAMRLMHLGRRVYIKIARRVHAHVAVVTARPDSPVAAKADVVLSLDDRPSRRPAGQSKRFQPLGSLFEQALLVVLDQVVLDLMEKLDLTEEDMARIHTGFE